MDAPSVGVEGAGGCGMSPWTLTGSYRYYRSFRHFVGSEDQPQRQSEHSQVENYVQQSAISLRYRFDDRWSVEGTLPYFSADRSQALRDASHVVVARYHTHAD